MDRASRVVTPAARRRRICGVPRNRDRRGAGDGSAQRSGRPTCCLAGTEPAITTATSKRRPRLTRHADYAGEAGPRHSLLDEGTHLREISRRGLRFCQVRPNVRSPTAPLSFPMGCSSFRRPTPGVAGPGIRVGGRALRSLPTIQYGANHFPHGCSGHAELATCQPARHKCWPRRG